MTVILFSIYFEEKKLVFLKRDKSGDFYCLVPLSSKGGSYLFQTLTCVSLSGYGLAVYIVSIVALGWRSWPILYLTFF